MLAYADVCLRRATRWTPMAWVTTDSGSRRTTSAARGIKRRPSVLTKTWGAVRRRNGQGTRTSRGRMRGPGPTATSGTLRTSFIRGGMKLEYSADTSTSQRTRKSLERALIALIEPVQPERSRNKALKRFF